MSKPRQEIPAIEIDSGQDVETRRDAALLRLMRTPHSPLKPPTDTLQKRRGRPPKPKPEK